MNIIISPVWKIVALLVCVCLLGARAPLRIEFRWCLVCVCVHHSTMGCTHMLKDPLCALCYCLINRTGSYANRARAEKVSAHMCTLLVFLLCIGIKIRLHNNGRECTKQNREWCGGILSAYLHDTSSERVIVSRFVCARCSFINCAPLIHI